MVTENGYHAIRFVIRVELLLHTAFFGTELVELFLEGNRGVICTEDFRCQPFHV